MFNSKNHNNSHIHIAIMTVMPFTTFLICYNTENQY